MSSRWLVSLVVCLLLYPTSSYGQPPTDLNRLQGRWKVVSLVENGIEIPPQNIPSTLPSGGKFHIQGNKLAFTTPQDGREYYRNFSLDVAIYPRGMDVSGANNITSKGIYRFDENRLIVCLGAPNAASRPTEFSAEKNSQRVLIVLEPDSQPALITKPMPTAPVAVKPVANSEQIRKLLVGSWRHKDKDGSLNVTFNPDGTFSTIREYKDFMIFHKAFAGSPMSSGTWTLEGSTLVFRVTASSEGKKVNQVYSIRITDIDTASVVYVDQLGKASRDERIR